MAAIMLETKFEIGLKFFETVIHAIYRCNKFQISNIF